MKEWWNALEAKQKGIIGGIAGAIVIALIVLIAMLSGKGKSTTEAAIIGTDTDGEPIYAAIDGSKLNTLQLELDDAGNLIVETKEDGTVIVPTNEEGDSVVILETDAAGTPVTQVNDAGQFTAKIDQKATAKAAKDYVKAQQKKAEETEKKHKDPTNPVPADPAPGTIRTTNGAGEFIQDVEEDKIVTPGPGNLDPEEIKNYETVPSVVDEENSKVAEASLQIESVGKYSGVFVENGEDIYLENVASMLVTNTTDRMIQVARFTMQVNGNPDDVALFQVTDLPAGASALIFELNKREYTDGEEYTLGDELHTFYETEDATDKFSFQIDGDLLTLTNLTDETFDTVYVHYKYIQEGGAYLGGIAYRSTFRSIGPKESVTTSVTHYTDKVSQIVRVETVAPTEESQE